MCALTNSEDQDEMLHKVDLNNSLRSFYAGGRKVNG